MDINVEKECGALGGLFQQIVTDMKNGAPLWEDLISKATKLHTCLRAAISAVSAYLEAFQKIADAATNARGATKEIGTALTRICLRHKAVETRMKSFTCAIMDCLVTPLQEKLEDWKKSLVNLDKEHAKEYKKAKAELKKRSTDTFRLQKKKVRKGQTQVQGQRPVGQSQGQSGRKKSDDELSRLLETSAAVVNEKRLSLEETERKAVRAALLEERGRYCLLARFLKPVLDEEIAMLMELTHLQEVSDQLERHAASPFDLPAASEQIIIDLKTRESGQWAIATPPSSPSLSLGSRKSSTCSIGSLTSSSSGSSKNHTSPCAHAWHRSLSQPLGVRPSSIGATLTRLRRSTSGSDRGEGVGSRDSGFTSQDTLYKQAIFQHQVSNATSQSNRNAGCTTISRPLTTATWPDLQESAVLYDLQAPNTVNERPHTISSAYEKGHQRPALSVYTFQAPDRDGNCCHSQPASPVSSSSSTNQQLARVQLRKNSAGGTPRPPIPSRCSSLERPTNNSASTKNEPSTSARGKPKLPIPAHLAKELGGGHPFAQPMYVNMHELANLAANRAQEMQQIPLLAQQGIAQQAASPASATVAASPSNLAPGHVASSSITGITIPDKQAEGSTEKDGGGSQTSESSLESSSGYGSQTTLPHSQSGANQNPENSSSSSTSSSSSSSSSSTWNAGAPPTCILSRRGSMQQTNRPPPPARRTSTIISGNYSVSSIGPGPGGAGNDAGNGNVCNAPTSNVIVSTLVGTETSAVDGIESNVVVDNVDETENLPPPPAFLLEGSSPTVSPTPRRSISVSETVRTLTELRHTPASPSFLRKATTSVQQQQTPKESGNQATGRSIVVERTASLKIHEAATSSSSGMSNSTQLQSIAPGGVGHSFMAALSSKFIGNANSTTVVPPAASPKSIRKHNTCDTATMKNSRAPSAFLESLNAKLAQQQPQQTQGGGGTSVTVTRSNSASRSASVRRIMGNRVPIIDPIQVRDSLMDQIRRGTSLRKTSGPINDRSAPQIY